MVQPADIPQPEEIPPSDAPAGAGAPGTAEPGPDVRVPAEPDTVPDRAVPQHVVTSSRTGAFLAMAVGFAVVLLLLLIFILENGQRIDVAYFGVHGHLPLGVALLLAAVFGILLVVVPGIGRMVQLRRTAKRHQRLDAGPPK